MPSSSSSSSPFEWSWETWQSHWNAAAPSAALVSIALVSLYIFYKMFRILMHPRSKLRYDGDLNSAGQYHGHGVLYKQNGDKYVGEFRQGEFCGLGTYTFAVTKCTYTGEFEGGQFNGKGRETYPGGSVYVGTFKNGLRDGPGLMEYGTGGAYDGQWKAGRKHGIGRVKENRQAAWKKKVWKEGKVVKDNNNNSNDNEGKDTESKEHTSTDAATHKQAEQPPSSEQTRTD